MIRLPDGRPLQGNWRRRRGTKTDVHLYAPFTMSGAANATDQRPVCGKIIPRWRTEAVHVVRVVDGRGWPCSSCMVAAITAQPSV